MAENIVITNPQVAEVAGITARGFQAVADGMNILDNRITTLSARIALLEDAKPVTVKTPNNRLLLIGVGVYIGYKLADRKNRDKIKQVFAEAKDQVNPHQPGDA